jgi:hypothetical protein
MNPDLAPITADTGTIRVHLSRTSLHQIYRAAALASIVVLIAGQAHLGFLFVLVFFPLGLWLTYATYVFITQPYQRQTTAIAVAIWLMAVALLGVIHLVRHNNARVDADAAVVALRDSMASSKRCPAKLDDLNLKRTGIPVKLRAEFVYVCEANKPRFAYFATFTILDSYSYDFVAQRWRYQSWVDKKEWLKPG